MEKSRTFARLLRDNSIKFKPQINKILKRNGNKNQIAARRS